MAQGLAHASNMENLCKEVQRVCSGTSNWFVPEPSQKSAQSYILIAMRRFKNLIRRGNFGATKNYQPKLVKWVKWKNQGIWIYGYQFKYRFKAYGWTQDWEAWIWKSQRLPHSGLKTFLKEAFWRQRFRHLHKKTIGIYEDLQKLKKYGTAFVPTEKTIPQD